MAHAHGRGVIHRDPKPARVPSDERGARLAMAGAPAKTIQELMGHADLATTMRYLHLTPKHKEAAIPRSGSWSMETSWRRALRL